jgi:methanogenic corrinoid protein MtbC1
VSNQAFAAELLKRSAAGYAGTAANLLLEKRPSLREQAGAFASWKSNLTQRTIELAAALDAGEQTLFTERVNWARKSFVARDQDDSLLADSIECLRDSLAESLPSNIAAISLEYVDAAIELANGPMPEPDASELNPADTNDRLALNYLQLALEGNSVDAVDLILQAADAGQSPISLYVDVLMPAQREIGRLWHFDEVSAAEEHLVSGTTQRAMAVLTHSAVRQPLNGKTVVSACVPSNVHDLGIRALSDLFHLNGWRSIYLGADVPERDLPGALAYLEADLLLLSATLSIHIGAAKDAVSVVREYSERPVKIVVGGPAFSDSPDTWKATGADAYAPTADEALTLGAELCGIK